MSTEENRLSVRQRENPLTKQAHKIAGSITRVPERLDGSIAYASRFLKGGKRALMELARISEREDVKGVVKHWDDLSERKRRDAKIEEICESLEVSPSDFLAEVVKAAFECNTDIGKLVAAVEHPRVVQAAIRNALKPKGTKDREMLMQASGLLPTGRGLVVNTQAIAGAKAEAAPSQEEKGLPSSDTMTVELSRVIRDHQ